MVRHLFLIACCMALMSCLSATHTELVLRDSNLAGTYWCHLYKPWNAAPKDVADALGYQPYDTTGRILFFCPSGELISYGGVLFKIDDIVSLSSGDGLAYLAGEWKISGDKLVLEYQLVWQDFPPIGQENAAHPMTRVVVPFNGKEIIFEGKCFTPMRNLSKETMERFFSCSPHEK